MSWEDVLGNYLGPGEVIRLWRREAPQMPLADWIRKSSIELWGADHREYNWEKLASELMKDAGMEDEDED